MLLGYNPVNLDSKGRIAIPTKYREILKEYCGGVFVLTMNLDNCLSLFPKPEWEDIEKNLRTAPGLNKKVKKLQRLIFGHATFCELDGQGRFMVPEILREYAGLNKRVALIGQQSMFEIWDDDTWTHNCGDWKEDIGEDDLDEISPELARVRL